MEQNIYKFIPLLIVLPALFIGVKAINAIQKSQSASVDTAAHLSKDASAGISIPIAEAIEKDAWSTFRGSGGPQVGSDNDKYRLAGTFFLMAQSDTGERKRLAIIDDISNDKQFIVSEGQDFQDHEVVRIYNDKLIMRKDARDVVLTLSFASPVLSKEPAAVDSGVQEEFQTSRYGKQVGASRWVLQKEALNDYYREILEDPERIAAIYSSMKPDLVDNDVAGYLIDKEGEEGFFDAVGLNNGDVIRKVNSLEMTSQRRGEYFLAEFLQNRLGAVVLDIEREGKPEKLIYLLR